MTPTTAALIEAGARAYQDAQLADQGAAPISDRDWQALWQAPLIQKMMGDRHRACLAAVLDQLMATGPSEGMLAAGHAALESIFPAVSIEEQADVACRAMLAELRREIAE